MSTQTRANPLHNPRCDRTQPVPGPGCASDRATCRYPECTYPHAAPSAEVPQPGRQARAIAADLIDTLLKIATWGFHDSNRDELRAYAVAARDALAAADSTVTKP